jgi:hypothetical protein
MATCLIQLQTTKRCVCVPTQRRTVMDRIWLEADRDGNGRATFGEFWQLIAATRSPTEEEMDRAYMFFVQLDKSGDGVGLSVQVEFN